MTTHPDKILFYHSGLGDSYWAKFNGEDRVALGAHERPMEDGTAVTFGGDGDDFVYGNGWFLNYSEGLFADIMMVSGHLVLVRAPGTDSGNTKPQSLGDGAIKISGSINCNVT